MNELERLAKQQKVVSKFWLKRQCSRLGIARAAGWSHLVAVGIIGNDGVVIK